MLVSMFSDDGMCPLNKTSRHLMWFVSAAGQMEDSWRSRRPDPLSAGGGAAKADHCYQEGHVGPSGGERFQRW